MISKVGHGLLLRVSSWDICEDFGLQLIRVWGHVENLNLEILDLKSPKGSKTRVDGGGVAYIYVYIYIYKTHTFYIHMSYTLVDFKFSFRVDGK